MAARKTTARKQQPAKRRTAKAGSKTGKRRAAKTGESLLIDVARTVGTTLGALAARSSQAAERLRVATRRKRS